MEQAVYELATVKPHAPEKRHYGYREWEIYAEGYYMALAASLKVMQLAARSWERMMEQQHPRILARINGHKPEAAKQQLAQEHAAWRWTAIAAMAVIGVFALEGIILLAELIVRAAR